MFQKFLTSLLIVAFILTSAPAFALRGESIEGAGLEETLTRALQDPTGAIQRFSQSLATPSAARPSAAGLEERHLINWRKMKRVKNGDTVPLLEGESLLLDFGEQAYLLRVAGTQVRVMELSKDSNFEFRPDDEHFPGILKTAPDTLFRESHHVKISLGFSHYSILGDRALFDVFVDRTSDGIRFEFQDKRKFPDNSEFSIILAPIVPLAAGMEEAQEVVEAKAAVSTAQMQASAAAREGEPTMAGIAQLDEIKAGNSLDRAVRRNAPPDKSHISAPAGRTDYSGYSNSVYRALDEGPTSGLEKGVVVKTVEDLTRVDGADARELAAQAVALGAGHVILIPQGLLGDTALSPEVKVHLYAQSNVMAGAYTMLPIHTQDVESLQVHELPEDAEAAREIIRGIPQDQLAVVALDAGFKDSVGEFFPDPQNHPLTLLVTPEEWQDYLNYKKEIGALLSQPVNRLRNLVLFLSAGSVVQREITLGGRKYGAAIFA